MAHGRRRFQRRFLLFACRCGIRAFGGGRAPVFALLLFCAVCISGFLGDTCEVPFGNHSRRCLRCYWLSGWIEFFFGPFYRRIPQRPDHSIRRSLSFIGCSLLAAALIFSFIRSTAPNVLKASESFLVPD